MGLLYRLKILFLASIYFPKRRELTAKTTLIRIQRIHRSTTFRTTLRISRYWHPLFRHLAKSTAIRQNPIIITAFGKAGTPHCCMWDPYLPLPPLVAEILLG
jgi:hypothetical protein